jgi:phage host-nuclease inhibitor protein Gam
MEEDIKKVIEEAAVKTRKHFDDKTDEVKNHFDVVAEDLKGEIQQVAEGVTTNTQQLTRLDTRVENLESVKDDVIAIKTTLEAVNLPALKERIHTLEKRLTLVEARLAT